MPTTDEQLVLAHLIGRATSHPDAAAAGLYWMSDQRWRECIATLREQGHDIVEVTVARGDRAANEPGLGPAAQPRSRPHTRSQT
jgi:hypothetical protein